MNERKGVLILKDHPGNGTEVLRGKFYYLSLRMWLNKGEAVLWKHPFGLLDRLYLSEDLTLFKADFRYDREFMFPGLFYGIEGMNVGGKRILQIAPHLAFKEKGLPETIPPNALLKVEVEVLEERQFE